MESRALTAGAVALLLSVTAIGCGSSAGSDKSGSGGAGTMTVEQISRKLQDEADLPADQADCIAKALDDNGLGFEDFSQPGSTDDSNVKQYTEDSMTCFTTTTGS